MAGMQVPIDEVVHFDVVTSGSTGAAADADSTPTFAVYEEDTDTDIGVGGNMTKRTSLTGNYRGSFTASTANGFEAGKFYSVICSATVSSVAGKCVALNFRCVPAEVATGVPSVNATHISGDSTAADNLKSACDGTGYDIGGIDVSELNTAVDSANGDHGFVSIQDDIDAVKTKTDYLPSATAGASGGLFIVGANTGAVSITNSSGSALTLESTGSNGSGLACIGDGQGSGINASGGDSMLASGIYALGNSSLGGGIYARNSSGTGMHVVAAGSSAHGLNVSGYGTGSGIKASGGATDGDGLELAAGGSGKDLNAAEIDSIVTYVDCLPATLDGSTFTSLVDVTLADGAHGGASASLTLSDYSDFQAASVTVSDKTGFKLASDGLDSISTTEPDGLPDNFRERLLWLYRRLFKKTVRTATKINHYDDAGTSILLEQDISDSAGTETMGEAEEPT